MDHNIDGTKSEKGLDPSSARDLPAQSSSDQTNDRQDLIYLPAIEVKEHKSAPALHSTKKKQAPCAIQKKSEEPETVVSGEPETLPEYLPEYQTPTNGLRALLSTFDPDDLAGHTANTSQKASFETRSEASLIENDIGLPTLVADLPVSPDLPVGPTRWGLYLSSMVGGLAFLFVVALAYSHMSSPTGIDWAKARSGSAQMWHKLAAFWSRDRPMQSHSTRTAEFSLPEPLHIETRARGALNATTSRISTTAATPRKGTIATPTASEIYLSQKELEEQILFLEAKQTGLTKRPSMAAKKRIRTARLALERTRAAGKKFTPRKSAGFAQPVALPSTKINPDMERRIFRRAKGYLQQHDISSARMILQYAASQGSGLSAMALAETYDPNFTRRINLPNITTSRSDARKWYDMASRLGIKDAKARLKALK